MQIIMVWEINLENWADLSDNEQETVPVKKEVEKPQPKKPILKDKHGEIIINTLGEYVEPVKEVREARSQNSQLK